MRIVEEKNLGRIIGFLGTASVVWPLPEGVYTWYLFWGIIAIGIGNFITGFAEGKEQ